MRGEQYLTRKAQYELVYDKGRSWVNKQIVMKAMPNGLEFSRYGFSVSRRVGNAVVRNLVKRRLREIMRKQTLRSGWDIIIIARAPSAQTDFTGLGNSVRNVLCRAGIVVGEHEGASPATY